MRATVTQRRCFWTTGDADSGFERCDEPTVRGCWCATHWLRATLAGQRAQQQQDEAS